MNLKEEVVNLLYEYELENECIGEPSWEKLVVEIIEKIKE